MSNDAIVPVTINQVLNEIKILQDLEIARISATQILMQKQNISNIIALFNSEEGVVI